MDMIELKGNDGNAKQPAKRIFYAMYTDLVVLFRIVMVKVFGSFILSYRC